MEYVKICKFLTNILFRAMVVINSGPATSVDASPIVECLCKKLHSTVQSRRTVGPYPNGG